MQKDTSKSCTDACNGKCCIDNMACNQFTDKICLDGSCNGTLACFNATETNMVFACCIGASACSHAGIHNAADASGVVVELTALETPVTWKMLVLALDIIWDPRDRGWLFRALAMVILLVCTLENMGNLEML